jgi:hypothetical protein
MPPFTPFNALSADSEYEIYTPSVALSKPGHLAVHSAPSWPPATAVVDGVTSAAAAAPYDGANALKPAALPLSDGRQRFASEQLKVLNRMYALDSAPSTQVQHALAKSTGITYRSIQIWFQNKRQRQRKRDALLGRSGAPMLTKQNACSDSISGSGSHDWLQTLADAAAEAEQLPVNDMQVLHGRGASWPSGADSLNLFDGDDSFSMDPSSLVFLPFSGPALSPSAEADGCRRAQLVSFDGSDGGYSSPAAASPANIKAYDRGRLAADELYILA